MHLKYFHQELKHILLEGKHCKRLDKCLKTLEEYIENKVHDRLIKITKKNIPFPLKTIRRPKHLSGPPSNFQKHLANKIAKTILLASYMIVIPRNAIFYVTYTFAA